MLVGGGPPELPSQVRRVVAGQNRVLESLGPLRLGDPGHQAGRFCHSFGQATTLGLGPVDKPQGPPDVPATQYPHAHEPLPDRAAHPPLVAVATAPARIRSLAHAGQSRTRGDLQSRGHHPFKALPGTRSAGRDGMDPSTTVRWRQATHDRRRRLPRQWRQATHDRRRRLPRQHGPVSRVAISYRQRKSPRAATANNYPADTGRHTTGESLGRGQGGMATPRVL
jgi:hypothetical protein